ncbi:MAG: prepilin peptidase [Candidatus Hydrogenedentota bacterium]
MDALDPASQDSIMTILAAASFLMGGLIGSFLNVCVYRIPAGLSVVKPRSRCPKCEIPIVWYDNIPVISWLILGAKCRHCKEPISWQYPLVEAITAVLFYLVFMRFGLSIATPVYMLLAASLVLVTFVDLTDWTIPDEVSIGGMPVGIACAGLAMVVSDTGLLLENPVMSLVGLAVGFGILYALDMISLVLFKKKGMGFGDVKLLAMLGAFFGPAGVLLIIVIASFFGSIIGITMILATRGKETDVGEENVGHYLPFGPYIVLGGLTYMFLGPQLIDLYIDFVKMP